MPIYPEPAVTPGSVSSPRDVFFLPTGAVAASVPRHGAGQGSVAAMTSGTLRMMAIPLLKGAVVSSVSFQSGTTGLGTGTNQIFGLYSSARAKLAESADDTSTAWGPNAVKTLAMTSPFVIPLSGLYYLAQLVVATTVPNMTGTTHGTTNAIALAPILHGTSDAGITTLPANAAALTALISNVFGYVS